VDGTTAVVSAHWMLPRQKGSENNVRQHNLAAIDPKAKAA
jgi:hypothetical protein